MSASRATPRFGWPLLLLVGGLLCIGLALAEAERSIRSNTEIAESALEGYAKFAAWSYDQRLQEALRGAVRELLAAVNHGDGLHMGSRVPAAAELGHYLPWDTQCACHHPLVGPMPEFYLGFTLGSETLGVGRNLAPVTNEGWLVDRPTEGVPRPAAELPTGIRERLHDTMAVLARRPEPEWGYSAVVLPDAEGPFLLAIRPMPTVRGDTVVYGVLYPPAAIDSILGGVLDGHGLLPEAVVGGRTNREVLSLAVRDRSGAVLLGSAIPGRWRMSAASTLPESYGALTVQVQIRAGLVDQLIIGGLPRSRLPLLLALLALAAGLTAIAVVQLRRESRFARERSGFVASVSHELRTPLAQIRLVVDTLRLDREPDPVRRAAGLDLVDREVTRLQHLVGGILRFSRGAGEEASLPRVPIDVVAEVRSVVDEFAPLAAARGVQIAVQAEGAPMLPLGPDALRQILLNLLDNAVKFGPDGQQVTVTVSPSGTNGTRLVVQDAGPGIRADEEKRIWDAYARGTAAEARAVGGSGIGLAVVRDLVHEHGGRAWVEGAGAPGGRFVIDLPGGG